jgi:16S rRNA (guanine527-N7)-methyltransferase
LTEIPREPRSSGSSGHVSRETLQPIPESASEVFGPNLSRAATFAGMLATTGVERGLIGPRELPRLWNRHLLNCAVLASLLAHKARVVDVGSGAGLPGIPVALARPDLSVTLAEPLLRRTTFLHEAVQALDLRNVEVVRARAEELVDSPAADYVISRAVAPLNRLVRWCAPLVRPGGELIAIKGVAAEEEVQAAKQVLEKVGARNVRIVDVGTAVVDPPTRIVQIVVDRPYGLIGQKASSQSRRRER